MEKEVRIIIGGDIVPTKSNISNFENGTISEIIDEEILNLLRKADFRVFNLETPMSDVDTPIEKEGPCFRTSKKSIIGLKELNPDLFTLANNHILDQGIVGLDSTIDSLHDAGIAYVGVGSTCNDAGSPYITEIAGRKIGFFGCAEHEYSVATDTLPGANPFDSLETPDLIREIKNKCEFLIVLYHGGKEYYEYPSPQLQKRCRKLADCGADLIICQHSHCVGSFEEYGNSKILYGQGNFLLDRYVKAYEQYFQSGLLVSLTIKSDGFSCRLIPIKRNGNGVRLADDKETKDILQKVNNRSVEIQKDGFVIENYKKYVKNIAYRYIFRLSRFGYVISSIDNRFFGGKLLSRDLKKWLGSHQRLAIQNCLQCEAHNEILKTYLDNRG